MTVATEESLDLVALTLVMEGRVALDDAVRVLMARGGLDRAEATEAIVRAAAFASDEYAGGPLARWTLQAR